MNKYTNITPDGDDYNDILEKYSTEELSEADTTELAENVEKKISRNRLSLSLIRHLRALTRYLIDGNVKWYRKSIVVATLIYFLIPVDSIPDFIPFFGFLDDIGVVAFTIKFLGSEIQNYY
jgi:uncharacterized membrane protein YkvA (DUF1232 family)